MRHHRVLRASISRRTGALFCLAVMLAAVPAANPRPGGVVLLRSETVSVRAISHPAEVLWILALGSDARPGENPLRERADAIQLVGVNLSSRAAVSIGIPRDTYVTLDGPRGPIRGRINDALEYGGPPMVTQAVANLVRIAPDYTVITTFEGFRSLVRAVGGVSVQSPLSFTDPAMVGSVKQGENQLNGFESLFFVRARKNLPRGDFDRSANQGRMLTALARRVVANQDRPGFFERVSLAAMTHLTTDLTPVELYRLGQALSDVEPDLFVNCVLEGSIGFAGPASVVFLDLDEARRLASDVRRDATVSSQGC